MFTIVNSGRNGNSRWIVPFLAKGRVPPFDPGSFPAELDVGDRLDLTDPIPEVRCVMYDEWGAVFGKDIFKESVEKDISIRFLHCFTVIPGRGANKTVICAFLSSIEEGAAKPVFQAAKCFDTFYDFIHSNPFAEILKQPIAE